MKRWGEFFEDDTTTRKSMNRLATFIAIAALTAGFFGIMVMSIAATGVDLREYLGALTTIGIIIAGLGGFNYAAGRVSSAYTEVRVAQAEKGLQPTPPPPANPATTINVGEQAIAEGSPKRKRRRR